MTRVFALEIRIEYSTGKLLNDEERMKCAKERAYTMGLWSWNLKDLKEGSAESLVPHLFRDTELAPAFIAGWRDQADWYWSNDAIGWGGEGEDHKEIEEDGGYDEYDEYEEDAADEEFEGVFS